TSIPPNPKVAYSTGVASARSVPIVMIAAFCATLGVVLVIAVIDMLSPGAAPTAGERAPSWPAR
ncbi:MAG: hypothetical protein ACMG6S_24115, partial [Byssovorax sp.]